MKEDNEPKQMDGGTSPSEDDDEIIDLVDIVEEDEEIIELIEPVAETVGPEEGEELIDLAAAIEDTAGPHLDETESPEFQIDQSPAEEMRSTEPVGAEESGGLQYGDAFDDEMDTNEASDDFVQSLGMDLESDLDAAEDVAELETESTAAGALSPEQIESAVERVLMRILPERIESILVEAIERVVTQEIKRIKSELLDD